MFYWTGKACSRGHLTYRYVYQNRCRQCIMEDAAKYNNYLPEGHQGAVTLKSKMDDLKEELELPRLEKEIYNFD